MPVMTINTLGPPCGRLVLFKLMGNRSGSQLYYRRVGPNTCSCRFREMRRSLVAETPAARSFSPDREGRRFIFHKRSSARYGQRTPIALACGQILYGRPFPMARGGVSDGLNGASPLLRTGRSRGAAGITRKDLTPAQVRLAAGKDKGCAGGAADAGDGAGA